MTLRYHIHSCENITSTCQKLLFFYISRMQLCINRQVFCVIVVVVLIIWYFVSVVGPQIALASAKPISQSRPSVIICRQKCEMTSTHQSICWQDGQTAGHGSDRIQRAALGGRERLQLQTDICLLRAIVWCEYRLWSNSAVSRNKDRFEDFISRLMIMRVLFTFCFIFTQWGSTAV